MVKQKLMKEISDIIFSLDLSTDVDKKGDVRRLLNPVLLKYFTELSQQQASSVSTVVVHFIYKDFGLMRGELQSITLDDLKIISKLLEEERIGQLFEAERVVREGIFESWNVNSRGILTILPKTSTERSSTPSSLTVR